MLDVSDHFPGQIITDWDADPFTTIGHRRVSDDAVELIESLIMEGRLAPGEKLPPERELRTKLGISRPSLREALRALTLMGALEARQGDGTYVSALNPDRLLRGLRFLLALDPAGLGGLFEVRELLEGGAARIAALRAEDTERARIQAWLDSYYPDASTEVTLARDLELHAIVVGAAHNRVLSSIITSLSSLLLQSRSLTYQLPAAASVEYLSQMAAAILVRDSSAAEDAMVGHLRSVAVRYEAAQTSSNGPSEPTHIDEAAP